MSEGGCRRKKEKQSKVMQLGGMGLEELPPLKQGAGGRASLTAKMNRKAMQVFGGMNSITKYLRWERSRQE